MSPFRNDLHAAHERIVSIERDLAASRADDVEDATKIAALEQQLADARVAIEQLERGGPRPPRVSWLRTHRKWVLWGSLVAVIVGSCFGLSRYHRAYPNCAVLSTSQSDREGARRAFRRACDGWNGHKDIVGCANLGFELEATAPAEAAVLYQQACDARHAWSCYTLGRMHREGRGVPASPALATDLFRRACAGGEAAACKER